MNQFQRRLSRWAVVCLGLCLSLTLPVATQASENLPWEKDFETAKAVAMREGKPLFIMMTATWCGPCKSLEKDTLPHELVRGALDDFVWVQAFEDKEINDKYQCQGYPTLAFVNPQEEKPFYVTAGARAVGPFLRTIIDARKAGKLSPKPELEELASKIFVPNQAKIQELVSQGNAKALKQYLQPASRDKLREVNYTLVKVNLPESVSSADVKIQAAWNDVELPPTGLACLPSSVASKSAKAKIFAPGCKVENVETSFADDEAIATKVVTLQPLTPQNAARLTGRIFLPDGSPAAGAIVRIADIDWAKTDKKGNYRFAKLPPGEFTVRVEYPGGEIQDNIRLTAGKPLKQDAKVIPVATVGIRWSLQTEEGSTKLTGPSVREGMAYFSQAHSRFSLARGMETRLGGSDFMIESDPKRFDAYLKPAQREALAAQPDPKFFFWLFDASGFGNGLHLEDKTYEALQEVNDGQPFEPRKYFQFLRGEPLKAGQVYTVFCCRKKQYAKIEIIALSAPVSTSGSSSKRNP